MKIPVGLRVDVDTYRGMRDGVPALVQLLEKYGLRATFFMSVGPDNMGRNLWRLLKPRFLAKMLRSGAASLYGYDILLRGTCWPGPVIGKHFPHIIRMVRNAGHEVGLHAWDHYTWQARIDVFSNEEMMQHLRRGYDMLADILGAAPTCSAAAGWRCNEKALLLKESFAFSYNSDCRGAGIFTPLVENKTLTPQIPVTLPTYDEIIGADGVTDASYNDVILSQCLPQQLNVYTIHAEAEGIKHLSMFESLLVSARERNMDFVALGDLLKTPPAPVSACRWVQKEIAGREGWMAFQGDE